MPKNKYFSLNMRTKIVGLHRAKKIKSKNLNIPERTIGICLECFKKAEK